MKWQTHHERCRNASCPGQPNCGRQPAFYKPPAVEVTLAAEGLDGPDGLAIAVREASTLMDELEAIGAGRSIHLHRREQLVLRFVLEVARSTLA